MCSYALPYIISIVFCTHLYSVIDIDNAYDAGIIFKKNGPKLPRLVAFLIYIMLNFQPNIIYVAKKLGPYR